MRAARRDLPALTRLWQACFGDPGLVVFTCYSECNI